MSDQVSSNRSGSILQANTKQIINQWSDSDDHLTGGEGPSPKSSKINLNAFSISNNSSTVSNDKSKIKSAPKQASSNSSPTQSKVVQEPAQQPPQPLSLAERLRSTYQSQSIAQMRQVRQLQQQAENNNESVAGQEAIESSRVMYSYLFQENKKKVTPPPEKYESLADKLLSKQGRREEAQKAANPDGGVQYISALNTRRNPDILVPGAKFLKGNTYFKKEALAESKEDEKEEGQEVENADSQNEEIIDPVLLAEADEYDKLVNQQARYFREENPTIKCRNCMEYGHMARECPNKTKRSNCILCGKDTHDSFSCNEKICFKCNKVGHVAMACKERNIIKCNRCGLNGHKEMRCLKVQKGEFLESQMQFLRCMECGKQGHVKCTKEKVSAAMNIDTMVKDDLAEFIYAATQASKSCTSKKSENTNLKVPDTKSNKNTYMTVYRNAQQKQGLPRNHKARDIYCCLCGDRHHDEECESNKSGNSKFQQFDKLRYRLNNEDRDYDQRDNYYGNNNRNNNYNNGGYNQRIAQDPRMTKIDTRNVHRNNGQKYNEESSSSYSDEEDYKYKLGKRKRRDYSESQSSSQDDESDSRDSEESYYSEDSEDSVQILTSFNEVISKNKQQNQSKYKDEQDYTDRSYKQTNRTVSNYSYNKRDNKAQNKNYHQNSNNDRKTGYNHSQRQQDRFRSRGDQSRDYNGNGGGNGWQKKNYSKNQYGGGNYKSNERGYNGGNKNGGSRYKRY